MHILIQKLLLTNVVKKGEALLGTVIITTLKICP
jgi:hypothetical protein